MMIFYVIRVSDVLPLLKGVDGAPYIISKHEHLQCDMNMMYRLLIPVTYVLIRV